MPVWMSVERPLGATSDSFTTKSVSRYGGTDCSAPATGAGTPFCAPGSGSVFALRFSTIGPVTLRSSVSGGVVNVEPFHSSSTAWSASRCGGPAALSHLLKPFSPWPALGFHVHEPTGPSVFGRSGASAPLGARYIGSHVVPSTGH